MVLEAREHNPYVTPGFDSYPMQRAVDHILSERLADLSQLRDNVSRGSIVGRPWHNLVQSLESVIDEVENFGGQYVSASHGPLPPTADAARKLQEVVRLLAAVKPIIIGMDEIERKDQYS